MIAEGGIILDWHTCDIYPERWPDLVVVLRCDHTLLWERLEKRYVFEYPYVYLTNHFARGYPLKKIQENNEVEIMQVVLDEARSSYPDLPVVELQSDGPEQLESNVARIIDWIQAWKTDHPEEEE